MSRFVRRALSTLLLGISVGCHSVPDSVPPELSQREIIQLAQKATGNRNWEAALLYYRTIIERFADDTAIMIVAEYEIAFIQYKQNNLETAHSLFESILERYENEPEFGALPLWPKVLSEKIFEKIDAMIVVEDI